MSLVEILIALSVVVIGFLIKVLSKIDKPSPSDLAVGAQSALSSLMVLLNHLVSAVRSGKTSFTVEAMGAVVVFTVVLLLSIHISREADVLKKKNDEERKTVNEVKIWAWSLVSLALGLGSILYALKLKVVI